MTPHLYHRSCANGSVVPRRRARRLLAGLLAISLCASAVSSCTLVGHAQAVSQASSMPADLLWARRMVADVAPQNNAYATDPTIVQWAGVAGAQQTVNRSVCSTFVDRVVEQAYGYSAAYVTAWLGLYAKTIHRAIVHARGFARITTIPEIRPGDIMAIEYYDDDRPSTGHAMIVDQPPQPIQAVAPIVAGTEQYGVTVIDSALSGHGPTDTRAELGGAWHTGVGRGLFRLYADANGHIAGYSWSATAGSRLYRPSVRDLVVGRLTPMP